MELKLGMLNNRFVSDTLKKMFESKLKADAAKVWRMLKFRKAIHAAGEDYNEAMKVVLAEYGTTQDDGQVSIPADKVDEFRSRMQTLEQQAIELPELSLSVSEIDCAAFSIDELGFLEDVGVLTEG